MNFSGNATVILVHGAWADGSSWQAVIRPLHERGLNIIAAPLPLTSLRDDAAALKRTIARTYGYVIVAGHAYAGAVIATANEERVKGLVYVAALAPDEGETVAQMFYKGETHPNAPQLAPDADGFIWMPEEGFANAFAQNATLEQLALAKAVQRPIAAKSIQEPVHAPAWRSKPTWYLIAEEDRMIDPKTQHFMADRMKATVKSFAVDHTPLLTAPSTVVSIILEATKSNVFLKPAKLKHHRRTIMNKNSVAIVTGASQGIGRSTAIRLARDFSAVVLAARNGQALEEVAEGVRTAGAEPLSCALDLSQLEASETLVRNTLGRFGRIDALLNIAGAVPQIDLFEMTDEQWKAGMELKLHGARRLTIRAWKALKHSEGSVVFMSGSAALDPRPAFAAVASTNAAITALAKAFAERGIKDGVQVNSIVPGAVMTGRRRSLLEKWAPAHNMSVDEAIKRFPEEAGIARHGQPEEIAELLGFMVSPAAKWMTGTSVRMDGGEVKGI